MWSSVLFVVFIYLCPALTCPAAGVVGQGYQNLRRNPGAVMDLENLKDTQYYDNNEGEANPENVEATTDAAENANTENDYEPSVIVLVKEKILGDNDTVTEPTNTDEIETTNDDGIETTNVEGEEKGNGDGDGEQTANGDGEETTNGNDEEINNGDGDAEDTTNADDKETTIGNDEETITNGDDPETNNGNDEKVTSNADDVETTYGDDEEMTNGNDEKAATATAQDNATGGDNTGGNTDPTIGDKKQTTKSGHYRTSTRCTLDENFDIPSAEATTNGSLEATETTSELSSQAQQGGQDDDGNLTEITSMTSPTSTTTRALYKAPKNHFTDIIFIDDN